MNRADKLASSAGDDRASTTSDESLIDVEQSLPTLLPPPKTTRESSRSVDAPLPPYFDDPRLAKLVSQTARSQSPERRTYASNLAMAATTAPRLSLTPSKNSKNSLGDEAAAAASRRDSRRASSVQLMVDKVRADLERRRLGGGDYRTLSLSSEEDGPLGALGPLSASPSEAGGLSDDEEVHAAGLPDQPDFQLSLLHSRGRRKSRRRRSTLVPQVIAALAVSVGSMLVGFTAAYTSPALASMQLPDSRLKITDEQASWIGSLMPLSALCGGLGSGTLIEKLGRKITIMGTGLPFMLSYALIAFAQDVYMIYVARVIAGLCIGTLSLAMPVYLGETIQPDIRGTLGLLPTTIGNTGILVCFLVGTYLRWDHLALFAGCIPVPFLVMMWFVPETPRWYVTHGNMKEAAKSLRWLRGKDVDITDELNSITEHITTAQRTHTSLRDLLSPHYLRALAIALALMFFQQMSGINAVIFYSVSIFKFAGSTIDGNLCSVVVGLVNFGATFIANVMIDRLGRKILLYISSALMVASLAVLGGFFYLKDMTSQTELVAELGWLPLVSFMVFVVAFSVGWGPIPWLFLGEGLPSRIRGSAGSVATAFNWACTFVVTKTFTDMIHSIGAHGTFWVFGACTAVGLLFTIGFMPETRGKTLEDIEKNLFTTKQGSMRKRSSVPAEL